MNGLRKFWAFALSLISFTVLLALKDYDPISMGTALAMITGVFIAGNAAVHIKGQEENKVK